MSTQRKPEFVEEELSDQAVQNYLAAHPDFFERHSGLLSKLTVPHGSGEAISLVERQVSMLRQKELKMQNQLKELIEDARANDILAAKIHEFSLQLLRTATLSETIKAVETGMRSGFGADQSILVIFADPADFDDIDAGRFFRVIERESELVVLRNARVAAEAREEIGARGLQDVHEEESLGLAGIGTLGGNQCSRCERSSCEPTKIGPLSGERTARRSSKILRSRSFALTST